MNLTAAEMMTWVSSLMWPFMRVGAMFAAAPILGTRSIPVRVRILLAVIISWILVPIIPPPPVMDLLSAQALLVSLQQVLIGLSSGFILQMVFAAFVVGGQMVAMGMGLGFASIIDPQNGVQVPVISQVFLVMVTLIFLSLNGHLVLIEMLADSFHTLPVGVIGVSRDGLWQLLAWGGQMFAGGVLVALPAVTALLLVNIAFGVTARAAPQLNIFAVGFPVMILVGFVFLFLSLPTITTHLSGLMMDAFELIRRHILSGGP